MKLIIAGSRTLSFKPCFISGILASFKLTPEQVVCGEARGVDASGDGWAKTYSIKVKYFPANWEEHGLSAGPIRNREMAKYADALLLIWDGKSRGSANMRFEMFKLKKPIYEIVLRSENA